MESAEEVEPREHLHPQREGQFHRAVVGVSGETNQWLVCLVRQWSHGEGVRGVEAIEAIGAIERASEGVDV